MGDGEDWVKEEDWEKGRLIQRKTSSEMVLAAGSILLMTCFRFATKFMKGVYILHV